MFSHNIVKPMAAFPHYHCANKNQCQDILGQSLFLFSEIKGLRDTRQVEVLQDQAQVMLNDYIHSNNPTSKTRFGRLLLVLPVMRTVSPRTLEEIFFRRTIGNVPIERLLCDMFKSC